MIPGLIDTHTHPRFRSTPEATELEERLRFMFGVTTTRDAGTGRQLDANLAARARHTDPGLPVPRLFVSGYLSRADSAFGGADRVTPSDDDERRRRYVARTRFLADREVDAIKVKEPFSEAELRSIADEARVHGLHVYGHAFAASPRRSILPRAVESGQRGLSHLHAFFPPTLDSAILGSAPGPDADPDTIRVWRKSLWARADETDLAAAARELAARGVWLEPVLISEEHFRGGYRIPDPLVGILDLGFVRERTRDIRFDGRPRDVTALLDSALAGMRGFVREFHEAGGLVATGTDRLLIPGLNLHEELHALVRAGLTPEAALAASTRDAAIAIGAADSLGTLEPGKLADFLVLEADPLAEIGYAMLAWRIGKAGRLYDPNVLFEILLESGAGTLSRSRTRLIGAGLALGVVLAAVLVVLIRHRRKLASGA